MNDIIKILQIIKKEFNCDKVLVEVFDTETGSFNFRVDGKKLCWVFGNGDPYVRTLLEILKMDSNDLIKTIKEELLI